MKLATLVAFSLFAGCLTAGPSSNQSPTDDPSAEPQYSLATGQCAHVQAHWYVAYSSIQALENPEYPFFKDATDQVLLILDALDCASYKIGSLTLQNSTLSLLFAPVTAPEHLAMESRQDYYLLDAVSGGTILREFFGCGGISLVDGRAVVEEGDGTLQLRIDDEQGVRYRGTGAAAPPQLQTRVGPPIRVHASSDHYFQYNFTYASTPLPATMALTIESGPLAQAIALPALVTAAQDELPAQNWSASWTECATIRERVHGSATA